MTNIFTVKNVFKKNYQQFLKYTKPDTKFNLLAKATILIVVTTNTLMIWLMGDALDKVQQQQYEALPNLLLLFAIIVIINQAMQFGGSWIINELCLRFIGRCRNAILSHSLKLTFPLMSKITKGDLLARLSNDVDIVSQVTVTGRLMLVSHVLTLIIYITMLFLINTPLALVAIATIPLYLIHQRYFSPRKQQATTQFLNRNAELLAFEEQTLSGLRGISSNTAETRVSKKHQTSFNEAKVFAMKERVILNGFSASYMLINYLVGLLIIVSGIAIIQQSLLNVGLLLSFILYLGYLTIPVRGITDIVLQYTGNIAAANRITDILSRQAETKDKKQTQEFVVKNGCIDFIDLSFKYNTDIVLFKNINIHLEGSQRYALVGPSGVGKSSLINLLMRFYDPQQGRIEIDGVNIRDISLESLRSNIAVVWQDNFLINDSIKENLLIAKPSATTEQIIQACIAANAWHFIENLPQGVNTILGSNDISLSGGQQQRIAIAQAFLKDAPIIVFDEASSALDSESEQQIMSSVENAFSNRTLLIIAHRYSSIQNADQIIYFCENGKVVIGKHSELYDQLDDYRKAVVWQTTLKTA